MSSPVAQGRAAGGKKIHSYRDKYRSYVCVYHVFGMRGQIEYPHISRQITSVFLGLLEGLLHTRLLAEDLS